ncbi:Stage II sporulation protein P (SpoIIP) [Sporotomaculum syntrophicum]|uniref:Stage II sporulation protein P (SpoIIP) n=1 Tax=Sporotomaculum syntrophicum TaxID=182264 RepID=A0A9D2WT51_9FIRM|nr:stage II sporulation protein P [Sporotomaculum syntrophicum]KAF1086645.1 Stage II sporulation protein P (SpoIIP) [Sporotomaculum syntrophicum]
MKPLRAVFIIVSLYYACLYCPLSALAEQQADHMAGVCYEYIDQHGNLVTLASRKPARGDEIINSKGYHYQVSGVQGNTAQVKLIGKDKIILSYMDYYEQIKAAPVVSSQAWQERPVGIYHTHSDESYLPTDGKASIPFNGGIYQVGDIFNNTLQEQKVKVDYNKTPHCPHDANAYYRSRRTAVKLLEQNPVAIFDVHRDGIDDPEFYRQIISEQDVTQIRLVVGRQNPKMSANLDFAKRLMAYVNKKNPELIKEIYLASGNYNQDLMPTALLIEAGTYTNEKPQAENGVALLANAVPEMLGLTPPPRQEATELPKTGPQGWGTVLFIALLVVLGGVIFIFINNSEEKVKNYLLSKIDQLSRRRG